MVRRLFRDVVNASVANVHTLHTHTLSRIGSSCVRVSLTVRSYAAPDRYRSSTPMPCSFDATLAIQAKIDNMTPAECDWYLETLRKSAETKQQRRDMVDKPIVAALFNTKFGKLKKQLAANQRYQARKKAEQRANIQAIIDMLE